MNKKFLTLVLTGALAVPGAALAQVTISGSFRVGVSQQSVSNLTAGSPRFNAGGVLGNTSETRVSDNETKIILGAKEDLGAGLTAVGRYEFRPLLDGSGAITAGAAPSGTERHELRDQLRRAAECDPGFAADGMREHVRGLERKGQRLHRQPRIGLDKELRHHGAGLYGRRVDHGFDRGCHADELRPVAATKFDHLELAGLERIRSRPGLLVEQLRSR